MIEPHAGLMRPPAAAGRRAGDSTPPAPQGTWPLYRRRTSASMSS